MSDQNAALLSLRAGSSVAIRGPATSIPAHIQSRLDALRRGRGRVFPDRSRWRTVASTSCISSLLAGLMGLTPVTQAAGEQPCTPKLTLEHVQFSDMQPPTFHRAWSAVVSVDPSGCRENAGGYFDIVFTRLSETAPDLDFRERFRWASPSVKISVDFGPDEAVARYRIGNVTSCDCRE